MEPANLWIEVASIQRNTRAGKLSYATVEQYLYHISSIEAAIEKYIGNKCRRYQISGSVSGLAYTREYDIGWKGVSYCGSHTYIETDRGLHTVGRFSPELSKGYNYQPHYPGIELSVTLTLSSAVLGNDIASITPENADSAATKLFPSRKSLLECRFRIPRKMLP